MSELFDAKERIKELEARPVEVAVQEPDPAEVERRAGEKAREMTAMMDAQLKFVEDQRDDALRRAYAVESTAYMVAARLAETSAVALDGMRTAFWEAAKELSNDDFSSAAAPLVEAARRILDCEWDDDEDFEEGLEEDFEEDEEE